MKLIAAQFFKPYVKSNKNDRVDAAASCEAMSRPHMRFVSVKTVAGSTPFPRTALKRPPVRMTHPSLKRGLCDSDLNVRFATKSGQNRQVMVSLTARKLTVFFPQHGFQRSLVRQRSVEKIDESGLK